MFSLFPRKGDTLVRINDIDLQNVTPEEVAYIIADGSPKLVSSQTQVISGTKSTSNLFFLFFFSNNNLSLIRTHANLS